jgi:hypothetical protein
MMSLIAFHILISYHRVCRSNKKTAGARTRDLSISIEQKGCNMVKREREVAVLNRPENSSTGQINGKQTMINQTSLFYHQFNKTHYLHKFQKLIVLVK